MKNLLLFLISLIFSFNSYSVGLEWSSRFNGSANSQDFAYAIALDNFNNIVVTGFCTNSGTGRDFKTIKYSPSGNILWEASYNGPINAGDYSNALAIDNFGNVYVTGRADFGGTTLSDIITIKYNSSGAVQWIARYNGPGSNIDEGKAIRVLNDGSVIVAGRTTGTASGLDFVTIKYNPDGSLAWSMIYNGTGNNEDYAVAVDFDALGNIYTGGCSIGNGTGQDFAVIKYSPAGDELWVKRYNGSNSGGDALVGLKVDNAGFIIAGGFTDKSPAERFNFLALKYDNGGNLLWEAQFNGSSSHNDIATSMTVDNANNVILTGLTTQTYGTRLDSNYGTVKFNPFGTLLWYAVYDGPSNSVDISRSVFTDNALNVYITGSCKGTALDDYATIKYSPSGQAIWIMQYNGTGNSFDYSSSIVADADGNTYVTGRSIGNGSDYDYATLKYSNLVGINGNNNEIPLKYALYQNYPNPFNPETIIKYDLPQNDYVIFKIFDIKGNLIYKLNEFKTAGQHTLSFNGSDFSSGTYFYRIESGNFSQTRKMILIK
jgi:uncharacterized delta-60 repeat protein